MAIINTSANENIKNINIETIGGMTAEEIINLMAEKGIGITGSSTGYTVETYEILFNGDEITRPSTGVMVEDYIGSTITTFYGFEYEQAIDLGTLKPFEADFICQQTLNLAYQDGDYKWSVGCTINATLLDSICGKYHYNQMVQCSNHENMYGRVGFKIHGSTLYVMVGHYSTSSAVASTMYLSSNTKVSFTARFK